MTDQPRKPAGQKDGGQYASKPNTATGGMPPTTPDAYPDLTYEETLRLFQNPTETARRLTDATCDGGLTVEELKAAQHVWETQPHTESGNLAGLMLEADAITSADPHDARDVASQWDDRLARNWVIHSGTPTADAADRINDSIEDLLDYADREAREADEYDPFDDPDAAWHDRDFDFNEANGF